MRDIISLMRPKHWIKNVLIFIPAFFSKELWEPQIMMNLFVGFFCFSLVSSIVYIFNDIKDMEKDRQHEIKCMRPLASGAVSKKEALRLSMFLGVSTVLLGCLIKTGMPVLHRIWCGIYFMINLAYSMKLKNVPIVDVAILASGFMIRVFYGAAVSDVTASGWLCLTVMSFALYMGIGKRRNELYKTGGSVTRNVLQYYDTELLDKYMMIVSTLGIVFYSLWAGMVIDNRLIIWTVPLVLFIVMKYEMLLKENSYGDPVEVLLSDKGLFGLVVCYAGLMFLFMYGLSGTHV